MTNAEIRERRINRRERLTVVGCFDHSVNQAIAMLHMAGIEACDSHEHENLLCANIPLELLREVRNVSEKLTEHVRRNPNGYRNKTDA